MTSWCPIYILNIAVTTLIVLFVMSTFNTEAAHLGLQIAILAALLTLLDKGR